MSKIEKENRYNEIPTTQEKDIQKSGLYGNRTRSPTLSKGIELQITNCYAENQASYLSR